MHRCKAGPNGAKHLCHYLQASVTLIDVMHYGKLFNLLFHILHFDNNIGFVSNAGLWEASSEGEVINSKNCVMIVNKKEVVAEV